MEQHIRCIVDSPLLQRVSRVRERMGLGVLRAEIPVSELDPFLLCLLRKEEGDDPVLDSNVLLQDQKMDCPSFQEKWHTWIKWYKED